VYQSISILFYNKIIFLKTKRIPSPTDGNVLVTSLFAVSTGSIGAALGQIPNQPTVFLVNSVLKNKDYFLILKNFKSFHSTEKRPTQRESKNTKMK